MSKHTGHYLKPGVRVSAPGVLFALVIDPRIESGARTERDTYHTFGAAEVCVSHWRRGKWTAVRGARCHTAEQLAEWMAAHASRRARNYVYTPSAGESLALGGVWSALDSGPVKWVPYGTHSPHADRCKAREGTTVVRRVAISPRVGILDYARYGLRWVWLSARQYFDAPEEDLAESFQWEWPDTGVERAQVGHTYRTGRERAGLWMRAFQELTVWWRTHSNAPWALTASGLSKGILRTHIAPKTLTTHTDEWCYRLEREACYGGRATTWFFGDLGQPHLHTTDRTPAPPRSSYAPIAGPLHQVDVRSMYPWLLRERDFPISKTSYREDRDAGEPQAFASCTGVIARVTIETDVPEYPCRVGTRIMYPVGRFTTTLTGPELLMLKGEGRVVKCHAMSQYHMGRPFREAAGALIAMREGARERGRPAWELFAKLLGNGLGGKLAQRKGQWVDRPKHVAIERFGEWYEFDRAKGRSRRFRAIAGLCSEYVPDATGAGPYTAAFAYLAAYGRLHMRAIREGLPERSVVSQDTDGLWLTREGREACEVATGACADVAGALREVACVPAARFLGPRHYWIPGEWVLAGFSSPTIDPKGWMVSDTARHTPLSGPAGSAPRGVCVSARTSILQIESPGLKIGRDGWGTARYRRGGM